MRTHGTLKKWNDERGFGFIAPAHPGDDIFVHVSAFPRDGVRPRIGELVSFETEAGPDGKLRALRVMRPGQQPVQRRPRAMEAPARAATAVRGVVAALAIAAIAMYAYSRLAPSEPESAAPAAATPTATSAPVSIPAPAFRCDGRTMCSQMTSCAEARYFLNHCPNTRMDGNHDGEPCEQQWCN